MRRDRWRSCLFFVEPWQERHIVACLNTPRDPRRVPSSLARPPTPFAKGKRNARRAFAALVTAAPCWQMPRNRPDCSPSGQFEWQPDNFVARRSPTGKGDPGRILSLLARVGASSSAQWQIKGVTSVCVRAFFFLATGPPFTMNGVVSVAAVCRSTGSHYASEGPRTSFQNVARASHEETR